MKTIGFYIKGRFCKVKHCRLFIISLLILLCSCFSSPTQRENRMSDLLNHTDDYDFLAVNFKNVYLNFQLIGCLDYNFPSGVFFNWEFKEDSCNLIPPERFIQIINRKGIISMEYVGGSCIDFYLDRERVGSPFFGKTIYYHVIFIPDEINNPEECIGYHTFKKNITKYWWYYEIHDSD